MSKILSVGQCGYDDSRIQRVAQQAGLGFERASGADDAGAKIDAGGIALVLINRIFDADGGSGIDLVSTLKSHYADVPVMLVSDYADAQAKAIANGAIQGFGKSALGDPRVIEQIKAAVSHAVTR